MKALIPPRGLPHTAGLHLAWWQLVILCVVVLAAANGAWLAVLRRGSRRY
jgi:hypothetical protein